MVFDRPTEGRLMVGLPTARTAFARRSLRAEPSPETSRIRIAVHDLAVARAIGPAERLQRAEDILSSLLFPRLLAATNAFAAGRIDNAELIRLTSALLTSSMRAGNANVPALFVETLIDRSLARLADHLCADQHLRPVPMAATVGPALRRVRPRVG
jgi:hypothetical protein